MSSPSCPLSALTHRTHTARSRTAPPWPLCRGGGQCSARRHHVPSSLSSPPASSPPSASVNEQVGMVYMSGSLFRTDSTGKSTCATRSCAHLPQEREREEQHRTCPIGHRQPRQRAARQDHVMRRDRQHRRHPVALHARREKRQGQHAHDHAEEHGVGARMGRLEAAGQGGRARPPTCVGCRR